MLGLAERAEEASTAIVGDELDAAFADAERALRVAGQEAAAASAAAVRVALAALSDVVAGPRLATPLFLDRVGAAAAELGAAWTTSATTSSGCRTAPRRPRRRSRRGGRALALATGAGDPSDFSRAMTATTGAVEALADDVLARLRSYD